MKKKEKWYDNARTLTTILIGIILIIIVCSQSFVAPQNFSLELFESILNHNSIYLLVLVYFILVKLPVGKKYFNYLNIFLIFIYFLSMITSALTLVQSFSLNTVLTFALNVLLVLYLVHTLFRDTRIWKDYNLSNSPFNELGNEWFYYSIIVVSSGLLAINLISTVVVRGVLIAILDCIYVLLFARYIFLYREYLDQKQLDSDNKGNFDEIREDVKEKVQEVLDKTEIDEKIVEVSNNMKEKVQEVLDKTEVDEKIVEVSTDVKEKVQKVFDKKEEAPKKKRVRKVKPKKEEK